MIYSRHLIKVIPMAVVATFLTMLPTTAFAASPPNIVSVVPISLPDTIAGQTIPTGYQVGDSVIYPSSGGYSILANPHKTWTTASKKAYVRNQQALKDLLTFADSPYSHSPEAQAAGTIARSQVKAQIQKSAPVPATKLANPADTSRLTSLTSASSSFVHFTFNDWDYFTVSGNSQGGFISDSSVLTGEADPISVSPSFNSPSNYLGWRPYTSVMDLIGTPKTVQLNLTWNFSGVTFGVSYPFPSVSPSSNGGTWSSGRQATWDYTWAPSQQPIYASSGAQTLTGTTEAITGTINVENVYGTITGYSGTHTIGWNGWNGSFPGNNS